jgi:transposase
MKRPRTPDLEDNKPSAPSEWTTPSRARVKQLKKVGFSALDIQKETGVPRTTQYTWLNAPVRRPGADRSGRPTKLDQDTVKKMIKSMEGHYDKRIWKWKNCVDEFELDCGADTVKNHFNQAGYYKCRCCQKSWINQNQADTRKNTCEEWKE